jgi:hypothetical protein
MNVVSPESGSERVMATWQRDTTAAASLIVIDEAARVADELLAQCTPNACGIEWKAGRPLDSSAVTVPTPCVKIPRPAPMSASGGS